MPIDEKYIRLKASRASGPGEQRVNRRSTKIQAWVNIGELPFSEEEKATIRRKLAGRINENDEFEVESEEERFQEQNRKTAVEKINRLIEDALYEDAPRIPTKPSKGAKEKRLRRKHLRYQKKKSRRDAKQTDVENAT